MESLSGYFLISTPKMPDPRFQEQVIYMCAHNEEGAMGLVINNPNRMITLLDILQGADIETNEGPFPHVYIGMLGLFYIVQNTVPKMVLK